MEWQRDRCDPASLSHARLRRRLSLPSGTGGTNLGKNARYAGENREPLQYIIHLSLSVREARENLEFFDHLSASVVRNSAVVIALAEKLIGLGFIANSTTPKTAIQGRTPTGTAISEEENGQTQPSASPDNSNGLDQKAAESNFDLKPRKKRGRPAKISDELKERALEATNSNKERAQILYQTRYPNSQQKKNVSSILRNYRKRRPTS